MGQEKGPPQQHLTLGPWAHTRALAGAGLWLHSGFWKGAGADTTQY